MLLYEVYSQCVSVHVIGVCRFLETKLYFPAWPGKQSRVISPNSIGGFTPFTPRSGLQEYKCVIIAKNFAIEVYLFELAK